MFSRDEHVWISAVRYALGRRTYIVGITVEYMLRRIEMMSPSCKHIMIRDIEEQERFGYGDECDRVGWMKLLDALRKDIGDD